MSEIRRKILRVLTDTPLRPQELFTELGITEKEGRETLSDLIADGVVVVGKNWVLTVVGKDPRDE